MFNDWSAIIRERDFGKIADWFSNRFFLLGGTSVGLFGIAAIVSQGWANGIRILALAMLMGGACTAFGWLIGLIFGIPRSLARPQPSGGGSATDGALGSSRVNTNLEDISDWLTKTIVGVGLTQLTKIPKFLGDTAAAADQYGFNWPPYGHLIALLLIIYCTSGGFWLGYVGTRTVLTKLFSWADSGLDYKEIAAAAAPNSLQPTESGFRSNDPQLAATDSILLKTPLENLRTSQEVLAWSAAHARSGDLATAKTVMEILAKTNPSNTEVRQLLATIYTKSGQHSEAAALLTDAPANPTIVLNALYEDPPGGFTKAISVGETLVARSQYKDDMSLHVWLACGYGQQYKYQMQTGASADVLAQTRAKVLSEIKTAISISPNARGWLFQYWKPAPGSKEDDLAAFAADDADFSALLEPKAPET